MAAVSSSTSSARPALLLPPGVSRYAGAGCSRTSIPRQSSLALETMKCRVERSYPLEAVTGINRIAWQFRAIVDQAERLQNQRVHIAQAARSGFKASVFSMRRHPTPQRCWMSTPGTKCTDASHRTLE